MLVQVEFRQPLMESEVRKLGSITERHGMRMSGRDSAAVAAGLGLIEIDVPRAAAESEAREVVKTLLDLVGARARVQVRSGALQRPARAPVRYSDVKPPGRETALSAAHEAGDGPHIPDPAWARRARRA